MKNIGYSKKILIRLDDRDLVSASEAFLRDIENNFIEFSHNYEKNKKVSEE